MPIGSVQQDFVTFFAADGQPIAADVERERQRRDVHLHRDPAALPRRSRRIRVSCLKQYEVVDFPFVFTDVPLP